MSSMSSCPICFDTLNDKIKASPDNCEHIFCLQCLEKWSKMGSYCPVDRKRFKKILNLNSDSLIQVKPHKRKRKRVVYDFSTSCEVCSGSTNANVLLLCDCCDLAYHTHCLKPPLKEVPAGLWFCPTCTSVEKRLKKKNGITKEVEAELGGFDSNTIKENIIDESKKIDSSAPATKNSSVLQTCSESEDKTVKNNSKDACSSNSDSTINSTQEETKAKKLDKLPRATRSSSVLQTCYDIISEFEDMTVKKNSSKDACSSNYLDSTVNKLDKIYKTFDNSVNKRSGIDCSKHLKTYSLTNGNRKSKRVDSRKVISETVSINPNDTSHDKGNASSEIDIQNQIKDCNILPDKCLRNSQRKIDIGQTSEFPKITSDISIIERRITRKSLAKIPVPEKNIKEDTEKSLKKRQKKLNRAVVPSYSEDSVPSSSLRSRNKSSKGSSKNLIQFSVFQRIEGIDASQEICSQISAVEVPFSSNIHSQHLNKFVCYDKFFDKSKLQCKLCKMNYISTKESKKISNYEKILKKEQYNKKYENINRNEIKYDYKLFGNQEKMSNSTYVLERRKRSLIRMLKKIHNSKCINVLNVN